MPEAYKVRTSRGIGTTRTRVGSYTAPSGANTIAMALVVANVTGSTVTATIEHHDGTNYTLLAKDVSLTAGQQFAPLSEVGKIPLETGHGIFVTCGSAAALDATLGIVEIT